MKFSIVTASYNQGRYIRDCIESVKAQTGVEWEHIVQDSCSTDETAAVLQEYPHLKVTIEKDRGMSDGINRGFLQASGDWVMWLNTDDYLLPGALEKVAAFATKHPDAGVIYGDTLFVKENKEIIRRRREHAFNFNILVFYGCYIQSTSTFFRREVIRAGNLLDVDYRVCMDYEYYVRLGRLGYQFGYVPEALAAFRWHETNTSAMQIERRQQERWRVKREHLRLTGRSYLQPEWMLQTLLWIYQARRALLLWQTNGFKR
jgi:glycosyltransferase involved in cell wall biosynthesis